MDNTTSQDTPVRDDSVKHLLEVSLQPMDVGDDAAGDLVGDFCLEERLGEGGFGVVWRATQTAPVRREVAIKLLKLGMDSREVLARFEQERHLLATMEHPCIAGMLGAGMTWDGRPFFVMELVRGLTLTRYAAEKKMPQSARLRLFIDLCHGVQHAHQKGVIHRDLKPSNVLVAEVDGRPVPKIIDFGIAKALTGHLDAAMSLFTRTGIVMGTPLYMAPEQLADRHAVDTRSDVYALGALFYELLTNSPPFPVETLTAKGENEMQRIIREVAPTKAAHRSRLDHPSSTGKRPSSALLFSG
jgi:eukaryotic-like serine/threonine-protein kinase